MNDYDTTDLDDLDLDGEMYEYDDDSDYEDSYDSAYEYDDDEAMEDAELFGIPSPLRVARNILGRKGRRSRRRPRVARGRRGVASSFQSLKKYATKDELARVAGVAASERKVNARAIKALTGRVSGVDRKLQRTGRELIKVNAQQSKQIAALQKETAQARQMSLLMTLLQEPPALQSVTATADLGGSRGAVSETVAISNAVYKEQDNLLFLMMAMGGLGGSGGPGGGMDSSLLMLLALSGKL